MRSPSTVKWMSVKKKGTLTMDFYPYGTNCTDMCNRCNFCGRNPCCCQGPTGPSIGTIIPYNDVAMYLSTAEPEVLLEEDVFIMPTDGTIKRLILSLEVSEHTLLPTAVGTAQFRVYAYPITSNTPTLVASGLFSPNVTAATPNGTILVADKVLNVPLVATTKIGVSISFVTNDGTPATLFASLTGGMHIV